MAYNPYAGAGFHAQSPHLGVQSSPYANNVYASPAGSLRTDARVGGQPQPQPQQSFNTQIYSGVYNQPTGGYAKQPVHQQGYQGGQTYPAPNANDEGVCCSLGVKLAIDFLLVLGTTYYAWQLSARNTWWYLFAAIPLTLLNLWQLVGLVTLCSDTRNEGTYTILSTYASVRRWFGVLSGLAAAFYLTIAIICWTGTRFTDEKLVDFALITVGWIMFFAFLWYLAETIYWFLTRASFVRQVDALHGVHAHTQEKTQTKQPLRQ